MRFAVVLLAAGASSRMGRPKLLLPWSGTTVLADLVNRWRKLGAAQIAVVLAPRHEALTGELDRLALGAASRIVNPTPERGMFSSVQCAAGWPGWQQGLTHWLLTLGDQPQVRTGTLGALIEFAAARPASVCQPARQGRARHPVMLPASALRQLALTTAGNLKQFLQNAPTDRALWECDDEGLDFDLDEPADYERALRQVAGQASGGMS